MIIRAIKLIIISSRFNKKFIFIGICLIWIVMTLFLLLQSICRNDIRRQKILIISSYYGWFEITQTLYVYSANGLVNIFSKCILVYTTLPFILFTFRTIYTVRVHITWKRHVWFRCLKLFDNITIYWFFLFLWTLL